MHNVKYAESVEWKRLPGVWGWALLLPPVHELPWEEDDDDDDDGWDEEEALLDDEEE